MYYSEEQKINALALLAANGGNYSETARDTGISDQQIRRWAKKLDAIPPKLNNVEMSECVETKKKEIADMLEEWTRTCIKSFKGKLSDASLRDASGSMKLSIDAMQLLRGDATSITGHTLSNQEIADKINALAPELKLRIVGE